MNKRTIAALPHSFRLPENWLLGQSCTSHKTGRKNPCPGIFIELLVAI